MRKTPNLQGGRNLTQETIEGLRAKIASGPMLEGDRLPTERQLEAEFGVSRTVIREAVAVLKSDGLIEPRRGAGIFVRNPDKRRSKWLPAFVSAGVHETLDILELRMSVEIEAAGLAATRRSLSQDAKIREALARFDLSVDAGASAVEADMAFHLAIAQSTNNIQFGAFLEALGTSAIPRSSLSEEDRDKLIDRSYLDLVQNEHRAIADAISAGDALAARDAMRAHLSGSVERYRNSLSA